MRRVVLLLALGVAALGTASTAAAQTGPPTLSGETINAFVQETAGFGTVTFTCEDGSGSGSFTTEGEPGIPGTSGDGGAFGPYPGTATESGEVEMSDGLVTALTADFTIFSGTTTITGTKTLDPTPSLTGVCGPFGLDQQFFQVSAPLQYEATIDTGSGTFTDSGVATIGLSCFFGGAQNTDTCTMQEGFTSEQLTAEPADECSDRIDNDGDGFVDFPADPGCESETDDSEANAPQCGDDDDGDGLRDDAESLFGGLLGNPDSDADGVRDGNEDDDDDGEDDEDEDDDECEDDDDDGDGEDDEDDDDD